MKFLKTEAKDILAYVIESLKLPTPLVQEYIDLLGPGDGVRGFGCVITIFLRKSAFICESFSSTDAKEAEDDASMQCLKKLDEDYGFDIDNINYDDGKGKYVFGGASGAKQLTDLELLQVHNKRARRILEKQIRQNISELRNIRSIIQSYIK